MTDRQKLRAIQLRLRETHRRMFDLQGQAISGLREALDAVSATHDEMAHFFEHINDLDDATQSGTEPS